MTVRILLNGIKLCKSNFYWVEFSDTQVEVRILLNGNSFHRSNEKVTSGIVAINAWKAHFKKFR